MITTLGHFFQRSVMISFLCLTLPVFCFLPSIKKTEIDWMESFEKAAALSKKKGRPLLLFFQSSDSSSWSNKMGYEIFEDPEFIEMMSAKFTFVVLDFPMQKKQDEALFTQNEGLKKKYGIEGFPSVVLLDPEQHVITKLGFLPVSGKEYAEHMQSLMGRYYDIKKMLKKNLNHHEWEKLYEEAKSLGCVTLREKVYAKGMKEHPGAYFLLEKYCLLLEEGKRETEEAAKIRKEVELRDPMNDRGSFYRLALLDFQDLATKDLGEKAAVEPLLEYIEKYGESDQAHLWKVEMMVSQFLCNKGFLQEALKHARACYKAAPVPIQKDIAESIQHIRSKLRMERRKR